VTDVNGDAAAANVRLGLRANITAFVAVLRSARKAEKLADRTKRRDQKRRDFAASRINDLNTVASKGQFVEAAIHGITASRMAALVAWGSEVLVWIGMIAMLANDPLMIYTSVLKASSIDPTKISLPGDLVTGPHPNEVRIAVAAGIGTAVFIVTAVSFASHALATLLSRGYLASAGNKYPAAKLSRTQLPVWLAAVIAAIASATLGWLTWFLHGVAYGNYVGSASATMGGTSKTGALIVVYVTALPWILLLAETLARLAPFEQFRKTTAMVRKLSLRQRSDIRRDNSMLRSTRRLARSAKLWLLRACDILKDIGNRTDYEATDSDLAGHADVTPIAALFTSVAGELETPLPIIRSGRVVSLYLPGLPMVRPTLTNAINECANMPVVPEQSQLETTYATLRRWADDEATKWLEFGEFGVDLAKKTVTPASDDDDEAPSSKTGAEELTSEPPDLALDDLEDDSDTSIPLLTAVE